MKQPSVSIIVPIYNVEKYLDRCIKNLINQSMRSIEIILVDDGSPDACPVICDSYAACDERIKVIHKRNEGLGFARNSGLAMASGEYVYFVDADDYLTLNAAEVLYTAAKSSKADICFGGIYSQTEDGRSIVSEQIYAGREFVGDEIVDIVLKNMLGAPSEAKSDVYIRMSVWQGLYSLDWIRKYNLRFHSEREFISEDIIFHMDALPKASKVKYIGGCYYYHIIDNSTSLTHRYYRERFNQCTKLYLEIVRRIDELNLNEAFITRAQRTYLGNVCVCIKQAVQYAKKSNRKTSTAIIKHMLDNEILHEVVSSYDYLHNPPRKKVFNFLIEHRQPWLTYCITRVFLYTMQ